MCVRWDTTVNIGLRTMQYFAIRAVTVVVDAEGMHCEALSNSRSESLEIVQWIGFGALLRN